MRKPNKTCWTPSGFRKSSNKFFSKIFNSDFEKSEILMDAVLLLEND